VFVTSWRSTEMSKWIKSVFGMEAFSTSETLSCTLDLENFAVAHQFLQTAKCCQNANVHAQCDELDY